MGSVPLHAKGLPEKLRLFFRKHDKTAHIHLLVFVNGVPGFNYIDCIVDMKKAAIHATENRLDPFKIELSLIVRSQETGRFRPPVVKGSSLFSVA